MHRIGLLALALGLLAPRAFAQEQPPPSRPSGTSRPSRPAFTPLVSSRLARDTISAALRAARYAEAVDRLDGFKTRTRLAAVLPELWVRMARSTDQSLRFAPTVDDPYHYSEAGTAGLLFEARVAWHFDRLFFDRDELSVEKMRVDRADGAARLANKVLATLFAWQKARVRAADPALTDEERATATLDEAEAEVELDVLTAGWFGERMGRH